MAPRDALLRAPSPTSRSCRARWWAATGSAVGDASGFIDPLFSSGAHVAMVGGHRAADALHQALDVGVLTPEQFVSWVTTMKRGTRLFVGAVQAFYDGTLVKYLFAENKRDYLKRAITSLLAGDAFDEAPWSNDILTRFAAKIEA